MTGRGDEHPAGIYPGEPGYPVEPEESPLDSMAAIDEAWAPLLGEPPPPSCHFTIVCTGRHTHPVTEAVEAPRPNKGGAGWRPHMNWPTTTASRMEWRCPVCGCNPRVGARNFDLLKEGQRRLAEAQVALAGEVVVREVPIDISYLEDYL